MRTGIALCRDVFSFALKAMAYGVIEWNFSVRSRSIPDLPIVGTEPAIESWLAVPPMRLG